MQKYLLHVVISEAL